MEIANPIIPLKGLCGREDDLDEQQLQILMTDWSVLLGRNEAIYKIFANECEELASSEARFKSVVY